MTFTLAWRNIWRNKKRTVITLASISFAVFFACLMQSMQLGTYERMIDNAVRFYTGHIQIHKKGYWDDKVLNNSFEYNQAIKKVLSNTSDIEISVPRLESFALAAFKEMTKGVMVVGINPEKENRITSLNEKIVEGAFIKATNQILAGKDLVKYLDAEVGDTIILISQGYHGVNAAGKYQLVGILNFPSPELNQRCVYVDLKTAQEFYGAYGMVTSTSILANDVTSVKKLKSSLKKKLNPEHYEIMDWKELMPELVQSIELDYYGGLILLLILYGVIAFGIFGTFLMMTNERTYEFGMLISLGMKRIKLQTTVALEMLILAFFGVIAGIIMSLPALIYLYFNPVNFYGEAAAAFEKFGFEPILPFSLDPEIFYLQAIFVFLITLILGLYPMYVIQKMRVVEALRQ
ncbi:MAG TPA: ABC transporter permease [Cyclobacteriaceae bacterium]